jgi:hypothetical protein
MSYWVRITDALLTVSWLNKKFFKGDFFLRGKNPCFRIYTHMTSEPRAVAPIINNS